jgi:LacI family transcriptional regulator
VRHDPRSGVGGQRESARARLSDVARPLKPAVAAAHAVRAATSGKGRTGKRSSDPAKNKPTIFAVADRAQVAISTVSRVLNGGQASELARQRVLIAIQELGYSPSLAAQRLVTRRAGCIGLAVNSSQSPWFSQILGGIEQALAPTRGSVLLASMLQNGSYDPSAVLAWIQEGRVDGLIFVRFSVRNQPLFKAASSANLPIVLIAPDLNAPAECIIRCNNVEAGRLVARHLARLGHQHVAFAGGPEESLDSRERLRGLSEGLAELGVTLAPEQIWFGRDYTPQVGTDYAERLLSQDAKQRPSAVVLGNDVMALAFMRRLLQEGVAIPGAVSVVGFDGVPDGGRVWPGLTTVQQPTSQMGATAGRVLLECVENPERERVTNMEYGVELLIRESTGPVEGSKAKR